MKQFKSVIIIFVFLIAVGERCVHTGLANSGNNGKKPATALQNLNKKVEETLKLKSIELDKTGKITKKNNSDTGDQQPKSNPKKHAKKNLKKNIAPDITADEPSDKLKEFDLLDCDTCSEILEKYYSDLENDKKKKEDEYINKIKLKEKQFAEYKQERKEKELAKYKQQLESEEREELKNQLTEDTTTALYGLVYRLSHNDCLLKDNTKTTLIKILFPEISNDRLTEYIKRLPFEEREKLLSILLSSGLNKYLAENLKNTPAAFNKLKIEMEKLQPEDQKVLMNFYVQMASKNSIDHLPEMQTIFETLNRVSSEQQRKAIKDMLPNLRWDNLNELLGNLAKIKNKEFSIHIEDFEAAGSDTKLTDNQRKTLNTAFRENFKNIGEMKRKKGAQFETPSWDITDSNVEKSGDCLFSVKGKYYSGDSKDYVFVEFISGKNKFTIFSDIAYLSGNSDDNKETMKKIIEKFSDFLATLNLLPLDRTETIIKLTDMNRVEAYINKSILSDIKDYSHVKNSGDGEWETISGFYIEQDFWEYGDNPVEYKMYSEITDYINKKYIGEKINALKSSDPGKGRFVGISGKYEKKIDTKNLKNQQRITIKYSIKKRILFETEVYFDQNQNPNNMKEILTAIIARDITGYLNIKPAEYDPSNRCPDSIKQPVIKYNRSVFYMSSVIPGFGQFYTGETQKGFALSGGFIASLGLLGGSLYYQGLTRGEYDRARSSFDEKRRNYKNATYAVRGAAVLTGFVYIANLFDVICCNNAQLSCNDMAPSSLYLSKQFFVNCKTEINPQAGNGRSINFSFNKEF